MIATTFVARARLAGGDSVFVRHVARLVAAFRSSPRASVDARSWEGETTWFVSEAASTRIGRAAVSAIDAFERAWPDASARPALARVSASVRSLAPAERVRAAGVWIGAAALTDAALTPFDPRPASLARWILWGAVLALAAVVAARPAASVAAWTEWRAPRSRAGRQHT